VVRASRGAVVVAALALLAGCGGKKGTLDKVVARAGDVEVTLGDFSDAWNKISAPNRPDISTLEAKRKFADDLVNQRILLAEADRLGGITDARVADMIDQRRRNDMLAALLREEVEEKVDVSAAEVEDLYRHRATNVKASHILLNDAETARRVYDDIAAGRISFAAAAAKYSLDQRTKDEGGSLGEIQWAQTLPEFQSRAFEAEPGQLCEPFETTFGHHVVRVDARVPVEQQPLEEARVRLRSEMRRQKESLRKREFEAELEKKAGLAWHEDGLAALYAGIERMTKVDPDTVPPQDRFLPVVTDEQTRMPVATFSGRDWTIGDYVAMIREQPEGARPPSLIPLRGLRELIRATQIAQELAYAEAQARGLGERPEIHETVQRLEEQVKIEMLHARFLQSVDLPEEEVRAYFDSTAAANPEAVQVPDRIDMMTIAHTEEAPVRDALRRIRAGEDEIQVIEAVSMDGRTNRGQHRTGLMARGTYAPQVEDVAFSGRVGKGWSEPVVTEGGTVAVKVLVEEKAHTATFEEVRDRLTQNLAQSRGEQAFEEWLDGERERRGVEIHDDVLELYNQAVGAGGAPPATAGPPAPPAGG